MASDMVIGGTRCLQRIRSLYGLWRHARREENTSDDAALHSADSIVFFRGQEEDGSARSQTAALQIWLFGSEWPDVLILFCEDSVTSLASANTIGQLKQIASERNDEGATPRRFHFLTRSDNDEANFVHMIDQIKQSFDGKTLGTLSVEIATGTFGEQWQNHLHQQAFATVDISASMASLLAIKDEHELALIRRACAITSKLYVKYLKDQLVRAVDSERKIRHSKLSLGLQNALSDEKIVSQADFHDVQMCSPAIIQSGGRYNLNFNAPSDRNLLHYGGSPIVCALGARYKSYDSSLVRTLLVNPSEAMKDAYAFLIECEELLMRELKDDVRLCDVYELVREKVEKERPELSTQLMDNLGKPVGIALPETIMAITSHCRAKAKKGMTFQVRIGLTGLKNPDVQDELSQTYALCVGDTVLVNENQPCVPFTLPKKDIAHVAIISNDDVNVRPSGISRRVGPTEYNRTTTSEQFCPEYQKALLRKVNERAAARLTAPDNEVPSGKARSLNRAYKTEEQLPQHPDIRDLKLYVDQRHETVLLPIHGAAIPFHISVIKNVSLAVESEYMYLRVNFFHPGGIAKQADASHREHVYLKELTYRASNDKNGDTVPSSKNLSLAHKLIVETQKKYKDREQEQKRMQGVVRQAPLILNSNRTNPKLKDLLIRPTLSNKKVKGTLESHTNGFRYTSILGDRIDILYSNVAHAFYQSCDNEMIILMHFHLKHTIVFGKRQQVDIQFYAEVGESTTDLGKHRNMRDREDTQAEQAERELRGRLKGDFEGFIDKVTQQKHFPFEFEKPFRPLGFHGAPHQSMVFIVPTTTCLVQLTEWPPFVMNLDDIELVHFERVSFQTKTFDMVFISKDYLEKVRTVQTIPMADLDRIKHWLRSCEICYTEGPKSLNWVKIMKAIVDDTNGFFADGGWTFLETDDDDNPQDREAADDSDAEEDDYQPDDDDDEQEEEGSESNDSDEESDSDESDDESGKSWSELEEEAKQADAEKLDAEFDDNRRSKKTIVHSATSILKKRPVASPPPNSKKKK